jgi:hypothetical protein
MCSRIRTITARSRITAIHRMRPLRRVHASASTPHTRCRNVAQSRRGSVAVSPAPAATIACAITDSRGACSRWCGLRGPGTTIARHGESGASTPW